MQTRYVLFGFLTIMAGMIGFALLFPEGFIAFLKHPAVHSHARFLHIAAVTLFFANAVVGILWERLSLASANKEVILHTYQTVTFLDSRLSSPLIILSVLAGLSLSYSIGNLWDIGWLSVSFLLFLLSGVLWIIGDIPGQYKIKRMISTLETGDQALPAELMHLLRRRCWISMAGVLPLAIVYVLMVYKPEVTPVAEWLRWLKI